MTGSFVVQGIAAARYKSFKVVGEEEWPPRFVGITIHITGFACILKNQIVKECY
jgi:hypothetical protein